MNIQHKHKCFILLIAKYHCYLSSTIHLHSDAAVNFICYSIAFITSVYLAAFFDSKHL